MKSPSIVVVPGLETIDASDVNRRRPEIDVREPADVVDTLGRVASPTVVLTASSTWRDRYHEGLQAGDWVATVGSGYENFPLDEFAERGVTFTHTPGANALQVAEHAVAMALSITRRLETLYERQRDREWQRPADEPTDLHGDTCCVVGMGRVGEAVGERVGAFGMSVRGVKRTTDGYDGVADEIYPADRLLAALRDARLVVLAVRLTGETRKLIGEPELAAISDDGILVNVARGAVLETPALLEALDGGKLGAACLDVTDPEPLPSDSPLWDHEDVFVTPHCGGVSVKYPDRFLDEFFSKYDRWRAGEPLDDRLV